MSEDFIGSKKLPHCSHFVPPASSSNSTNPKAGFPWHVANAVSSLLLDLESRGLLSESLILCLTEHGRTPRVKNADKGGGRDHWSSAFSVMLAGAGIKTGTVLGESDNRAAFVKSHPVSPPDILATMYHLSGVALERTIPDRLGRPVPLVNEGEVIRELLV